jgi:drug/metabolite transporter (DMT)-like permease
MPLSPNPSLGALAAVATAFLWAFTSIVFSLASVRAGAMPVNRVRLVMAVGWLVAAHPLLGLPLPLAAGGERWLFLGASGFVGLVLGDGFLFQAFVWIGPRLAMLLLSTAPAMASLCAWWVLGESLSAPEATGILVTILGVAWVVQARDGAADRVGDSRRYALGILCGLGGAAGQAGGLILAKQGMAGDFPPLSATLMRMVAAAVALWLYTLLRGQSRETLARFAKDRDAGWYTLAGSFLGPFVGVTLSLLAIQHIALGIASALMALTPIFLLPLSHLFFRERIGWPAALGTVIATAGVALMFLA